MRRLAVVISLFALFIPLAANATILRNLKMGDSGQDVRELQITLNQNADTRIAITGPGSPGNETTHFGVLTRLAVIRLQQKYAADILAPVGLTIATGFVGGQTRLFLLRLAGVNNPASLSVSGSAPSVAPAGPPPAISTISPAVVTTSTISLTITGTGFTPSGNDVIVSSEDPNAFTGISSADGTTLTFIFHFMTADALKKQLAPLIASGRYPAVSSAIAEKIQERNSQTGNAQIPVTVVVRNANGVSKPATLLVDITEILKEIGR